VGSENNEWTAPNQFEKLYTIRVIYDPGKCGFLGKLRRKLTRSPAPLGASRHKIGLRICF